MKKWIKYTGKYEKKFYDIKFHNGKVFKYCWPNAGTFHSSKYGVFDGSLVKEIRESEEQE